MGLTLQWLAGFFDGEGCIRMYGSSQTKGMLYPAAQITNTYLPILKAIQAEFGGSLCASRTAKYKGNGRICWTLYWRNKKAVEFLELIVPFLTVKKTQAELVIHGYKTFKRDGYKLSPTCITNRAQLSSKLTELKKEEYIQ